MLPWALKFLWAPLVDNIGDARMGRRRSWISPLQTLLAILFVAMGLLRIDLAGQWTFIALITLANIVSATQDIATDGLAVETLTASGDEEPLAWANGLQVGGFSGGMLLGGPLVLIAQDWIGQSATFIAVGVLLMLTLIPARIWREGARAHDKPRSPAKLRLFLARPQAARMLVVAALFNGQQMMTSTLIKPFLVDAGASASLVGLVSGVWLILLAIGSGLVGGAAVTRFGVWRSAVAGLVLAWFSTSAWIIVARFGVVDAQMIISVSAIAGIFAGIAYVTFFVMFMKWAAGDQAGTDFTLLQCAESYGGIALSSISCAIAGRWGITAAFLGASLVGLLAIAVVLGPARALARNPIGGSSRPVEGPSDEIREASVDAST